MENRIKKAKSIYDAKESFRKVRSKVEAFSTALGSSWDKGSSAIIGVLEKEGLELAKEFELTKPYAEFISNTLKLVQLANEKDEMTKAMGAFGDATLKLNYHTYDAVRNDFTTGELSTGSPLVTTLTGLIEEAITANLEQAVSRYEDALQYLGMK